MFIDLTDLRGAAWPAFASPKVDWTQPITAIHANGPFGGTAMLRLADGSDMRLHGSQIMQLSLDASSISLMLRLASPFPGYRDVKTLDLTLSQTSTKQVWQIELAYNRWFAYHLPIRGEPGRWLKQNNDSAIELVTIGKGLPLELLGLTPSMEWAVGNMRRHLHVAVVASPTTADATLLLLPSAEDSPYEPAPGVRLRGLADAKLGGKVNWERTAPVLLGRSLGGLDAPWLAAVNWTVFPDTPNMHRIDTPALLEQIWNRPRQHAHIGTRMIHAAQPVLALPKLQFLGASANVQRWMPPLLGFKVAPNADPALAAATLTQFHFASKRQLNGAPPPQRVQMQATFDWQAESTDTAAPPSGALRLGTRLIVTGPVDETIIPWPDVPDGADAPDSAAPIWLTRLNQTATPPEGSDVLARWHLTDLKHTVARLGTDSGDQRLNWLVWGGLEFGLIKCPAELECIVRGSWTEDRSDLYLESKLILRGCRVRESASTDEVDPARLDAQFGILDAAEDRLTRDSAPLRFARGDANQGRTCDLEITQRCYPGRNAVTRLMVRSAERSPFGTPAVVLQTRPFYVAQTEPAVVEPEGGDLLASWASNDPEGAQWRVPDSTVSVLLPPQAVGEAMERGARFWEVSHRADGKECARPWVDPLRPILYRFSPPTRLEVRPSVRERRYNTLPGNLGAVLRNAKLATFSTEMAYPMQVDFKVDEQGLPDIRIGETAGFLGRPAENLEPIPDYKEPPANPLPSDDTNGPLKRWMLDAYSGDMGRYALAWAPLKALSIDLASLRGAQTAARANFAGRLAQFHVFDPWSPQGGLGLTQQLTIRIRDTSLGAPPLLKPLPDWKLTDNATRPPERVASDLTPQQKKDIAGFLHGDWGGRDQGALPAGVVHTIEFASELVAVLRNPIATQGRIDALAFSALGASGHMSASFDEGRTTFIVETSFGQLSRLIKIRIGRLGVLWNKARHVVVYERTTVPSKQFELEQKRLGTCDAVGSDDANFGWPILRKTQEYVEPIETVRTFGAEGQKDKNRAAFLDSSEVITPRIYVNGAWGRDLGHGYEIPLWNVQDPTGFYPRPLLALRARAGGDAVTRCWLREPEHLVFYSNTEAGTGAETDRWVARAGVDCPTALPRLPLIGHQISREDVLRSPSVAAPRQDGLRRPRFDLAVQADGKVDLQHARGETQMLAVPEMLSIMRSVATGISDRKAIDSEAQKLSEYVDIAGRVDKAAQLKAGTERALAELLQRIALAPTDCETVKALCRRKIKTLFEDARTGVKEALEPIKGIKKLPSELQQPAVSALDEVASQWRNQETVLRAHFEHVLLELDALARSASGDLDTVRQRAIGQLSSARELATAAMKAQREAINSQLENLGNVADLTLQAALLELEQAATELENAFSGDWTLDLEPANAALSRLQRVLGPLERHALLGRHAAALTQGVSALKRALGETQAALVAIQVPLNSAVTLLANVLRAVAAQAQALQAALNDEIRYLKNAYKDLDEGVANSWVEALEALGHGAVNDGLRLATNAIRRVHQAQAAAQDQTTDLIAKTWRNAGNEAFTKLRTPAAKVDEKIQSIFAATIELGRTVADGIANLKTGVSDNLAVLEGQALTAVDSINCLAMGAVVKAVEDMADHVRQVAAHAEQLVRERVTEVVNQVLDERTRQRLQELEKKVKEEMPALANQAGEAIKLVKAFGELPSLPTLTFNADRAEYFFDDAAKQIETSPFAAKLREIDGGLKALGLAIPTRQLLDQIVPEPFKNLDFNSVFRQFGGIDFRQLLQRFKLPDLSMDQVCITQGVDRATRSAWIAARVNAEFPESHSLFEIAGVSVSLAKMRLKAASDLKVGLNGERQATTDAELRSDWGLNFGGAPLATFHEVAVRFDGSKFGFDIQPGNIELHPALKFVDEFAKQFTPKLPPAVQLVYDRRGMPRGAKANMVTVLTLPPLGVIAIGPLRIASGLALTIDDGGGFNVEATLAVGAKQAPVWVQIGYLGGGLWLEAKANYQGSSGVMTYGATVGVALGCIRAIGFAGVAYGSFSLLLFVQAEMSNAGGVLRAGLSVNGSARILGMCNASVDLLLEAIHSNGRTRGHGTLDVSVEICWCYTLHVRREVEHDIG